MFQRGREPFSVSGLWKIRQTDDRKSGSGNEVPFPTAFSQEVCFPSLIRCVDFPHRSTLRSNVADNGMPSEEEQPRTDRRSGQTAGRVHPVASSGSSVQHSPAKAKSHRPAKGRELRTPQLRPASRPRREIFPPVLECFRQLSRCPPPHDDRVWDLIEEAGDIGVKHVPAAGSVDFPHTLECHVAGASRPEAVRIVVKQPLEQWTAQSKRLFLCHALTHVRDIRRPCATDTFRPKSHRFID